MPSNTKKWLWKMLTFGCGIDEGRSAVLPDGTLYSAFQVMSETGKEHIIKSLGTGFTLADSRNPDDIESTVVRVEKQDLDDEGNPIFLTVFENNAREWLSGDSFISDDGTINDSFLDFTDLQTLQAVISTYPPTKVKTLLGGQGLKVTGESTRIVKRLAKHYVKMKVAHSLSLSL